MAARRLCGVQAYLQLLEAQSFYPLEPPIQIKAGDKIRVECTYLSTTGETVG